MLRSSPPTADEGSSLATPRRQSKESPGREERRGGPGRPPRGETVELVVPPRPFRCCVDSAYQGDVFIWDLDKTYLKTRFESLRDLMRAALQKAKDKVTVPGASALLRALRKDPNGQQRPIYFVSASPPQLAEVIAEKFSIDGVEIDGIYFKDNLRNVRLRRLRRLREQMGYKLLAMLDLRQRLPAGAVEVMFGDDYETDAATYALYSEILEHWIMGNPLKEFLMKQGVFRDEAIKIAWRARRLPPRPPARRIYIHIHRDVDPRYYRRFGDTVTATRNYFQTALALFGDDRISVDDVGAVAQEVLAHSGLNPFDLAGSLTDLVNRRVLPTEHAERVATALAKDNILPAGIL